MAIEIKILGAIFDVPAKLSCQFSPFAAIAVDGLHCQDYLAGAQKWPLGFCFFPIARGVQYLFYLQFVAAYSPTFSSYRK